MFITTSSFSADAKQYPERIDTRIILIDGTKLARLMIAHGVGVTRVAVEAGAFGLLRGGLIARYAVDLDHDRAVIAEAHTLGSRQRIHNRRPLRPRLWHAVMIDVRPRQLARLRRGVASSTRSCSCRSLVAPGAVASLEMSPDPFSTE